MEYNEDSDTNGSWSSRNGPQEFEKETGGIGDQRKNFDHPKEKYY